MLPAGVFSISFLGYDYTYLSLFFPCRFYDE
jgi:hypothetical protein